MGRPEQPCGLPRPIGNTFYDESITPMNFPRRSLVGIFLLSQLAIFSLGCGGESGTDAVTAPPDMNAPPPDPNTMMPAFTPGKDNTDAKPATP